MRKCSPSTRLGSVATCKEFRAFVTLKEHYGGGSTVWGISWLMYLTLVAYQPCSTIHEDEIITNHVYMSQKFRQSSGHRIQSSLMVHWIVMPVFRKFLHAYDQKFGGPLNENKWGDCKGLWKQLVLATCLDRKSHTFLKWALNAQK